MSTGKLLKKVHRPTLQNFPSRLSKIRNVTNRQPPAQKTVSVQPMSAPAGSIFTLEYDYGDSPKKAEEEPFKINGEIPSREAYRKHILACQEWFRNASIDNLPGRLYQDLVPEIGFDIQLNFAGDAYYVFLWEGQDIFGVE